MKIKTSAILAVLILTIYCAFSQIINIERVNPPFWWVGMKNSSLEILFKAKNIQDYNIKVIGKDITLEKLVKSDNHDYIILKILIGPNAKAGKFQIYFNKGIVNLFYNYELKDRIINTTAQQGLNSSDFVYLLIPDRFSNGDTVNDKIAGMHDSIFSRDSLFSRHGGDLQGVINHLDYFKELGATALWLTPFFETNQPFASYHGYAITDHYKVDPRLGDNQLYADFVKKSHDAGIKVIMDMVFNHIGNEHWIYKDKPFKNWFHSFDKFTKTNFRDVTLMDPYVSEADKIKYTTGWFDKHMPDLNQQDTLLATFLIQNTIWWLEYAGIDGIRLDTYPYPDQKFMSDWTKAILSEYPKLGLFGETWVSGLANQAFYTKNSGLKNKYNPQLPGVTDFQLFYAINNALTKDFGWTDGVSAIYYCLANDFLYENAYNNAIFLDNHDQSRFYSVVGEDIDKYKMGIAILLTMRGIPVNYYGTEILMKNFGSPDEKLREDFSGGWKNDKSNKFLKNGRTEKENEAFTYLAKLANYRKNNTVLQDGKLMQFIPENGVYVYFRYNENKTIMVIVNQNKSSQTIETSRFAEIIKGYKKAKNIMTDETLEKLDTITVGAKTVMVLELIK
ncbi:MAG: glycoside hydrolase family 13 protein [Bacteroidetes bacterium]|nr:glycoside hydrolase family 13 protein [Bacteroidota bacterium]